MAIVKPFRGIRPEASVVSRVAALPYDVYNRAEAKEAALKDPLSFLNIDRPESQFPDEVGNYEDCVYAKAKELLDLRISDGTFVQDETPCFYVYELTMNGRVQTGVVACSSVDEYQNGIIKKHENTREEKEQDRIRHVDTCNAQTGPIYLAYRANEIVNEVVSEAKKAAPLYDFVAEDGIRHAVWQIAEPAAVKKLEEGFAQVPNTYIADGHHRCASAVKVGLKRRAENPGYTGDEEFNYFLSVLFPDEQLMIMDYNRVVKDLNGYTEEGFLERLSQDFIVEKAPESPYHPQKKGEVGMLMDDVWYRLTAKRVPTGDPVEDLDVSVLQNLVLEPILGIHDPRVDKRVHFIGGIRGLGELERRCHLDMKVAFAMYPTSIGELFEVADASRLMPPKSTWFEPKLRSGLFIHQL